jgi:sulfotransferase 6B1
MSYQIKKVLRLHARDAVFLSRYFKEKAVSNGHPKRFVICNSYPKSGTHLLYQILYNLPTLQKWDDIVSMQSLSGIMNTAEHIRWKIGSAPNNSIIRSHLTCCEEVLETLQENLCKSIFIYRDLRDVAVSHARWVTKEPKIYLHKIYNNYDSFDKQLMLSIKGIAKGTPFGSNISFPDIGQDFARWQGWLQHPETLSVKFEDLVGARGGGCEEKRLYWIEAIVNHLCVEISRSQIENHFTSSAMNPEESHTFRKGGQGNINGWRKHFRDEHKTEFKKTAGQLLIDLGYEREMKW